MRKIWFVALAVALFSGCAIAPRNNAPIGPIAEPVQEPRRVALPESRREPQGDTRVAELVAYFAAVTRAGLGEQKRELAQSAATFGRTPTVQARLKLGGLYAQPVPSLRDDARAMSLLEPLAVSTPGTAAERPMADLASLLYAQVAERQRIERAETRKQEALREQIEAMKSIDRSIRNREDRQRAR